MTGSAAVLPTTTIERACDARALFGRSVEAVDAESAAVAAARSTADMKERGAALWLPPLPKLPLLLKPSLDMPPGTLMPPLMMCCGCGCD